MLLSLYFDISFTSYCVQGWEAYEKTNNVTHLGQKNSAFNLQCRFTDNKWDNGKRHWHKQLLSDVNSSRYWYVTLTQKVSSLRSSSSLMNIRISANPRVAAGANWRPMDAERFGPISSRGSLTWTRSGRLARRWNTLADRYGLVYVIFLLQPWPPPTGSVISNVLRTTVGFATTSISHDRTTYTRSHFTTQGRYRFNVRWSHLFRLVLHIIWECNSERIIKTRAQRSLGLADRTHGAHSQPASITVRVWRFEHVVACARNVNVVTCLFT